MSDVGERMLLELRRIREALEGSQPLGFGKRVGPTYVFVRHHELGSETYFWYSRDKQEGQNISIRERDLTGFSTNFAKTLLAGLLKVELEGDCKVVLG